MVRHNHQPGVVLAQFRRIINYRASFEGDILQTSWIIVMDFEHVVVHGVTRFADRVSDIRGKD